jgi:hypothetical protein
MCAAAKMSPADEDEAASLDNNGPRPFHQRHMDYIQKLTEKRKEEEENETLKKQFRENLKQSLRRKVDTEALDLQRPAGNQQHHH